MAYQKSIDELRKAPKAAGKGLPGLDLDDLRDARCERLEEGESYLGKAKLSDRPMLASESRAFDRCMSEADELEGMITRLALESRERAILPGHQLEGSGRDSRGGSAYDDGAGIALRHDRSVHAHVQSTQPTGETYRAGALARILRAKVTGNHRDLDDLELRALGMGSGGGGGSFLLTDQIGSIFIDKVRDAMVLNAAGMQTVPMTTSECSLIKVLSDGTPHWKAENVASTESSMEFGRVSLIAKTIVVCAKMSREIFDDAVPGAEALIENALVAVTAREVQRGALYGLGVSNEPRGLRYTPGITRVVLGAGNGSQIADYDFLLDAIARVRSANHTPTARISSSRLESDLASLKEAVEKQPLRAPDMVSALAAYSTNVIPVTTVVGSSADCTDLFVGDFSQLLMGVRTNFNLELSQQASDATGSAFGNLQVWVRVFARVDFAVMREDAFQIVSGIRPPA